MLVRFKQQLEKHQLSRSNGLVVAYSGGVDSHVLLYLCHQLKISVRAIHIHHGLQNVADSWVMHCKGVCKQLNLPLDVIHVNASNKSRQSPEDAARIARYGAIADNLKKGEVLLTAQHLDDQCETFLLQLMRGAGAAGLACMPETKQWQGIKHLRPLLNCSRVTIQTFAKDNHLKWIEDPSNQDLKIDRNYLRHQVLPVLKQRWPSVSRSVSNAAGLQQQYLDILEDMAEIDLQASTLFDANVLSLSSLHALSLSRQINLLRYWLVKQTKHNASRKLLDEIKNSILFASEYANPCIQFSGYLIQRYKDGLYLTKPDPEIDEKMKFAHWSPNESVCQWAGKELSCVDFIGSGLQPELKSKKLEVRSRQGGEVIQLSGHNYHKSLKALMQERSIPPWERQTIPLIYYKDELIAVVDVGIAKKYSVTNGESGWLPIHKSNP